MLGRFFIAFLLREKLCHLQDRFQFEALAKREGALQSFKLELEISEDW